jgi:hypothetical protein
LKTTWNGNEWNNSNNRFWNIYNQGIKKMETIRNIKQKCKNLQIM